MLTVLRRLRARLGIWDRGSAITEFCFLAILFLVPLAYLMLAVFDVQRAAYGTSAAARAASRAYVVHGEEQQAREAAMTALADQGIENGQEITFECLDAGCLVPEGGVIAYVEYSVPLPFVPQVLGSNNLTIPVESRHITPYGDYRQAGG